MRIRSARVEKFDPEMRFRPIRATPRRSSPALLIVLSCFHYYTAGFGLLRETTHRGVHLAFVLGLVFLVFPLRKAMLEHRASAERTAPGGVPLYDWLLARRDRGRRCSTCRTSSTTSRSASATRRRSTW